MVNDNRQKNNFYSLQELLAWNSSFGDSACNGRPGYYAKRGHYMRPCRSVQCFTCHIYGERMIDNASRIIWRAMENLAAVNYQLFHCAIGVKIAHDDWITSWSLLRDKSKKLFRMMRDSSEFFEYVTVRSQSETYVHMHMVSTVDIPSNTIDGLGTWSRPIKNTPDDRKVVLKYLRKNMREMTYGTSIRWSKSKHFYHWANPKIGHLKKRHSSVISITAQSMTKQPVKLSNKPRLKKCTICNEYLPKLRIYFHANGSRLRGECVSCFRIKNMALHANENAKKSGRPTSEKITPQNIRHIIKNQTNKTGQLIDFWTGEPLQPDALSIDHIICFARGGKNTADNICITSQKNNQSKGSMSVRQWLGVLAQRGVVHKWTPGDMPLQQKLL